MIALSVFVLGLFIGSFLNVVVLRTKSGKSFVYGRSECPRCHKQLKWYELVPLVSYIAQKGRCRGCKARLSMQYPLVEALTGAIYAGLYLSIGASSTLAIVSLVAWLLVASLLIAAAVYDYRWMILPDRFMLPGIFIAFVYTLILNTVFAQPVLISRVIAAIVFGVFFTTLWLVSSGKWLGDGDIRLAVLMGLMLSTSQLLIAIFFAFNIAAVVSLWLLKTKRKTRHDAVPLGPFLILGTFIGLFIGNWLVRLYLGI